MGGRELARLLFGPKDSLFILILYYFLLLGVFLVAGIFPEKSGLALTISSLVLFCTTLLTSKNFEDLAAIIQLQGRAVLGFLYLGLLPSFVFRLFYLEQGLVWFIFLLLVVFAGDTAAYLIGIKLGQHKLMPLISPKKSVEGALGGLLGSSVAATVFYGRIAPHAPLWSFVLLGTFVGIVAQFGDLFESLLKRVANRKDSGSIMPGHGGILDRLDGILFAAPFVYIFAEIFGTN